MVRASGRDALEALASSGNSGSRRGKRNVWNEEVDEGLVRVIRRGSRGADQPVGREFGWPARRRAKLP